MVSNPPASPQLPAKTKRRKPIGVLYALASIAALAALIAFLIVQRSSSLEWYISPPIDAQGRRVHVLVPVGWKEPAYSNGAREVWENGPNGRRWMTVVPNHGRLEMAYREWVLRLGLSISEDTVGTIYIQTGRDVCQWWNDPLQQGLSADGSVHVLGGGSHGSYWLARAIPIRGKDNQALVNTSFLPNHTPSTMADRICRSMYVE